MRRYGTDVAKMGGDGTGRSGPTTYGAGQDP